MFLSENLKLSAAHQSKQTGRSKLVEEAKSIVNLRGRQLKCYGKKLVCYVFLMEECCHQTQRLYASAGSKLKMLGHMSAVPIQAVLLLKLLSLSQ